MASLAGQNDFLLLRAAFPGSRDASGSPLIRQLPRHHPGQNNQSSGLPRPILAPRRAGKVLAIH